MTEPRSVAADGNIRVSFVAAIAVPTLPEVGELNAGTDITRYLTGDGFNHSTEQEEIADRRLSSTQTLQRPGRITDTVDLMYVYQAQGPISPADDNQAQEDLDEGANGFLVARYGEPYSTTFAVADVVDIIPVTCGVQRKMPQEANSVQRIAQRLFVRETVLRNEVVVADT